MRLLICVLPVLLSVAQCQTTNFDAENCALISKTFQTLMFQEYAGAHVLCREANKCYKQLVKKDPVKYKEVADILKNGDLFCDEWEFKTGEFNKCFEKGHLTIVRDFAHYLKDDCEMNEELFDEYQQIVEAECGEEALEDMMKHPKLAKRVFCPIDDGLDEDDEENQENDHKEL